MTTMKVFHLPTKPYNVVDAINRIAAATGSVRYAMAASDADYNGHHLRVWFNDYRGYYICEYQWGERVVLARGDCASVLRAARDEFARQGRGAGLYISVKPEDAELVQQVIPDACEGTEDDVSDPEHKQFKAKCPWYTWRHREVANALWWEKHVGGGATHALLCARDEADYEFLLSHKGREELLTRKPVDGVGVRS